MIRGLDLFSGIGGITYALSPWVRPVAYCEADAYCRRVLFSRMADRSLPVAPVHDDIRELRADDLPDVDIVYGGFPCQDISAAGLGRGLEGERSGLYFEVLRLVGDLRPQWVFLENVAAIRVRGADRVAGTLAGLGYDSRWTCLRAADVGAPHERNRWWLLARLPDADGRRREGGGIAELGGIERERGRLADRCSQVRQLEHAASFRDAHGAGSPERQNQRGDPCEELAATFRTDWWAVEPDVGRLAHGVPERVERLRALGNAVVPAQAREAFRRLAGLHVVTVG